RREGADRARSQVEGERDEREPDDALRGPLDANRPMRLAPLVEEAPDEDDRGDRVDDRVRPEPEQREAAADDRGIDRDGPNEAAPGDAQGRQTDGSAQVRRSP